MPKITSIAMLIRGALANALAFTGSSYMFLRLSKDSIQKEAKGHNFGDRAAPKSTGRMGLEMARKDQLHQQESQVGKESRNCIHRTEQCHERVSQGIQPLASIPALKTVTK